MVTMYVFINEARELRYRNGLESWDFQRVRIPPLDPIYFLTRVWVRHAPNAGHIQLFQHFLCKKAEKEERARKLRQNFANHFSLGRAWNLCPFLWGTFIKMEVLYLKCYKVLTELCLYIFFLI